MKKVLITGAYGFIGKNLVEYLKKYSCGKTEHFKTGAVLEI